ncbi:cupin domain-containing protein [Halocynthiibacter namhaensis]|uniref:cupin domain-containing protein n=1 Tax=Halocynthiibacter namhaensis TaxID=1290553 RepID=UPI000579001B|nr:cupin domain-containing protein [Halocynthiibacter namhaensis]
MQTVKPTLIKASEIDALDGVAKTHFLNPNASRLQKSLGDLCGLTGLGVHLMEIAPGQDSTEHHVHYFEDECVYILEGTGTALTSDRRDDISAGDFLGYPAGGDAHSITNTGDIPLRFLVIGQRLDHDVADYPNKDKRIFRNKGMSWDLTDIATLTNPRAAQNE